MSRSYRAPKREQPRDWGAIAGAGYCEVCGKVRYATKGDAKTAAKRIPHRSGKLRPYRCNGVWHIGHTPRAVREGRIARDEVPPKPRPPASHRTQGGAS